MSVFVALLALLFTDLVLAAGATATSVTGTVTVQSGTTAPRPLRTGDTVTQGDTIATGAASSAVLRFDDGEITALTANSRLAVTAYQYDPAKNTGNVFLSLVSGGMRAITGLIGRNQPSSVAYRAATATIGIRGTTVDVTTDGTSVGVSVSEGQITFQGPTGAPVIVGAGQGVVLNANGTMNPVATATAILSQLSPEMRNALGSIDALAAAITISLSGVSNVSTTVTSTTNNGTTVSNITTPGSGSGGGGTVGATPPTPPNSGS